MPGPITFFRLQSTPDTKLQAYIAHGEILPVATRSFGGIGVFAIPEMGRFYRHVLIQKNYPVHRAAPFLNELVAIEWDQGNEFFPATSMQIANIQAGTGSNNVIPGELFVQFNFRFSTELTDEMIKAQVLALLEKHQLRYTVDWWLSGQPFLTARGKLVDAVVNAVEHYNEIKPQLLTTGGTSDGRFIARMGAQVVELGPVNATIHKINECVNAADLQLLARMYQRIMEQLVA